jgi:ATP-binding cassette subfamily B protein
MSARLDELTWPLDRIGEAVEALARACGMPLRHVDSTAVPAEVAGAADDQLESWLEQLGAWLGVEVEPVACPYAELDDMVRGGPPALVRVASGPAQELRFLALVSGGRRGVDALAPDLGVRRLPIADLRAAMAAALEARVAPEVDRILARVELSPRRQARARAALRDRRLAATPVRGCYLLRLPPEAPLRAHARQLRLGRRMVGLLLAHVALYLIWIASWWVIGRSALRGRFEAGWMVVWVLLLLSRAPLRALIHWWSGRLTVDAGALVKERLFAGALRVDPDRLRHEGAGQLLGRVLESDAVERLVITGAFPGLFAILELGIAMLVMLGGAGGWLQVGLFATWLLVIAGMAWRYLVHRRRWTESRLAMTHDLIERMVGHPTRLAQERRERWHEGEDQDLSRYLEQSARMDRIMVALNVLGPRGWLLIGMAGLAPAFVAGTNTAALAIGLGGVLLGNNALRDLIGSLANLIGAAASWEKVAPIFLAVGQADPAGPPSLSAREVAAPATSQTALVSAREISYRYSDRADPALRGLNLDIARGDRVLLEGESGSGKSTLGALLAGVRVPDTGLLLLGGLDAHTLGVPGWRRRVVCAPQFHENHIFTGTLGFNLLMGRRWPPSEKDFAEAETLCRELGLGPLLDRMPSGILQMVGETGWQMSHGERSRVFIARALLQRAEVVVLDESFAALDPDNLSAALTSVLQRAPTLITIAHI